MFEAISLPPSCEKTLIFYATTPIFTKKLRAANGDFGIPWPGYLRIRVTTYIYMVSGFRRLD